MAAETQNSETAGMASTALPTTAMPAILPGLPSEVILRIFKATDSHKTALALSQTCHHLQNVWEAVLPSVVECFPQAQELAHIQEQAAQAEAARGMTISGQEMPSVPETPITTVQRISKNVDLATRVLTRFEVRALRASSPKRTTLTPTERADFFRGLYRALTLAYTITIDRPGLPQALLSPLDMLSYLQMEEAMDELNVFLEEGVMTTDNFSTEWLDAGFAVSLAAQHLADFHVGMMKLPVNRAEFEFWSRRRFGQFTLADGWQAKAGTARGIRLAKFADYFASDSVFSWIKGL